MVPEMITGQRRPLLEQRLDGEHRRLGVQRVEDGLDDDDVGTTVDQAVGRFEVGGDELVVGDVAGAGVVDVRRDRRGPGRRPDGASDETGFVRRAELVTDLCGPERRRRSSAHRPALHVVVGERDRVRVERVGLQDVRARLEILAVDTSMICGWVGVSRSLLPCSAVGHSMNRSPR